jgi:hypothetical protein
MNGVELTTLVVIGIDCTGSCKSKNDYSKTQRTKFVFVKYVNQYTRYIFLMKKKPSNLENTLKKMMAFYTAEDGILYSHVENTCMVTFN